MPKRQAKDLVAGDEVIVTVMGGTERLTVTRVDPTIKGIQVTMEWGFHVLAEEPVVDMFEPNKELEVVE